MKAIIIDDEPMPAKYLQELIKQHCFEIDSTKIVHSPEEGIKQLKEEEFDVLFLDVELKSLSGFDLLDKVQLDSTTKVIFTTAFSDYAVDAFKVNAIDYLVKPILKEDLIKAVRRVSMSLNSRNRDMSKDSIFIFKDDEYLNIKIESIVRFEADGSYTMIKSLNDTLLSSKPIGYYEAKMLDKGFIRCHNSHLINLKHIAKVGKGKSSYAEMINKDVVPIALSKKEMLHSKLGF